MRGALIAVLILVTPAVALAIARADGDGEPCSEYTELGPAPNARLSLEHATCSGDAWSVAVNDPNGRTELRWYDDDRGTGIEAHRPPRFLAWWSDEEGCHLILYAFGAEELGCVAGDPPAPPVLP